MSIIDTEEFRPYYKDNIIQKKKKERSRGINLESGKTRLDRIIRETIDFGLYGLEKPRYIG